MEKLWQYAKTIEIFEKICSFRTLIYFRKTMILLGKKTMILYRKLWNFDLLWKKNMVQMKKTILL